MEKMKAAVLGVGRMGEAICYAMHELGFYVLGADSHEGAAGNFRKHIQGKDGAFYLTDQSNAGKSIEHVLSFEKPDIVISSLPYHQTEEVAYWCIDNEFRYCDLGGKVDVSRNINKYAKEKASKPVMTDLGLAPGWINILAEQGYSEIHSKVDDIKMMVGGLPAIPMNPPLNYVVTWSIDGLLNEYRDDCEVLLDGEAEIVEGMSGLEKVNFELLDGEKLEAFYTSGGASHTVGAMKARGVKNCSYKTLRYKGHRDAVRFLISRAELSDDCLESIFEKGCCTSTGDIVLMKAQVSGGDLTWGKEIVVGYDLRFSGMQKATAFPISSVAALMAEGLFDGEKEQHRDYYTRYSKSLTYSDVPYGKFNKNLNKLGVQI